LAGTDELNGKSGNLIRAAANPQPAAATNRRTDSQPASFQDGSGGRSTSARDTLGTLHVDPVPFLFPLFSEEFGTANYRFYICT